ncbi:hypothetical protein [Sphingorhabdus contaminans]|uniref:hypothetical protein n=1 Tax=Sphingorhabdus contaminans TaxID=1343899 RepID=UPI003D2CF5E4
MTGAILHELENGMSGTVLVALASVAICLGVIFKVASGGQKTQGKKCDDGTGGSVSSSGSSDCGPADTGGCDDGGGD